MTSLNDEELDEAQTAEVAKLRAVYRDGILAAVREVVGERWATVEPIVGASIEEDRLDADGLLAVAAAVRKATLNEVADQIKGRFLPGDWYLDSEDEVAMRVWLRSLAREDMQEL